MKRTLNFRIYISILFLPAIITSCHYGPGKQADKGGQYTIPTAMCVPVTNDRAWYEENKKAPLFEGLDGVNFEVTTGIDEARKYFRQGMMLTYGFNHAEAARSFYQVTREDPGCAMGYWGHAYVLGPNYNAPMDPEDVERAYEATQKAFELMEGASPKEKALIKALQAKYVKESPVDRSELDRAFAEAMRNVYQQFPDDPDIGALFAESLMNLHPWDLWTKDGNAQPWTGEIVRVLERILDANPDHAGANHLYIHAIEASPFPEKGLKSAGVLETLVPASSHLVHMPSHIYINTGDYYKGSLSNLKAVEVDSNYADACNAQGVFPLIYYPHNYHFLSATATLHGDSQLAMKAGFKMAGMMNVELMNVPDLATMQHYYIIPYHIAVKFGMWDEILKMSNADPSMSYPESVRHYARGMAFLGKGDLVNARAELASLAALTTDTAIAKLTIWGINPVSSLVEIAYKVLNGEILALEGKYDESIAMLGEAIAIEDKLQYNEPPDWFFSVRHNLGAVLVEAGRYDDAIKVYNEDLEEYPRNGWAYIGLYNAYVGSGMKDKAAAALKSYNDAWQWSDVRLHASRIL
ncbi:MAG: tetratricopeptide repeat protein [Bacteroidales bacterium]